jgi:hypothetical protein
LLTTAEGEPLAVHVYEGNTSDPVTVPEQVHTLQTRFGITEVVFVGDRGMVQAKGKRGSSHGAQLEVYTLYSQLDAIQQC